MRRHMAQFLCFPMERTVKKMEKLKMLAILSAGRIKGISTLFCCGCLLSVSLLVAWTPGIGFSDDALTGFPSGDTEEAAAFGEQEAAFDEQDADFGEKEVSSGIRQPDTGRYVASLQTNILMFSNSSLGTSASPGGVAMAKAHICNVEGYMPPQYFPERQKRVVQQKPLSWAVPLVLILGMAPLVFLGKAKSGKMARTAKRTVQFFIFVSLAAAIGAQAAHALTYSSVKDAVTSSLGSGKKIFQSKIAMTPQARQTLQKDLQWTPSQGTFKVYYAKAADGRPQRYAFILTDKLAVCGGIHKYCIAINADGSVSDVKILELTCDRSYCINTRSFLAQFKKYNISNLTAQAKSYDAISGATLSTDLTRDIVIRALALYKIMKDQSHG